MKRLMILITIVALLTTAVPAHAGSNPFNGCQPVHSFVIERDWSIDGYTADRGETLCGIVVKAEVKNKLWRLRGMPESKIKTWVIPHGKSVSNKYFTVEWVPVPRWPGNQAAVLLTKNTYYASYAETPIKSAVVYATRGAQ